MPPLLLLLLVVFCLLLLKAFSAKALAWREPCFLFTWSSGDMAGMMEEVAKRQQASACKVLPEQVLLNHVATVGFKSSPSRCLLALRW